MSEFVHLSDEENKALDDYDEAVANGELPIVNGHAVNAYDPTQVWGKFVNSKVWNLS